MFHDNLDTSEGREKIPLITVLAQPPEAFQFEPHEADQWHVPQRNIVSMRRALADPSGALGPDGMKAIMGAFFARCVPEAEERGLDPAHFKSATLHWLRHTFGHSMADAKVDIRIIQKAMGHVNMNTSGGYIKADLEQMVRGLRNGSSEMERTVELLRHAEVQDHTNRLN